MEPRIYLADAVDNPPEPPESPSPGYPTDGNPIGGQKATAPGAWWIYKVGESLRRVIVAAGLTPSDGNLDLLKDAIFSGSTSKASQAEVDAGDDDNKFVTPKKLRWGFSILLEENGYLIAPSWLGSWIFQWGLYREADAYFTESAKTVTMQIAFPNAAIFPLISPRNSSQTLAGGSHVEVVSFTDTTLTVFIQNNQTITTNGFFWAVLGR